MRHRSPRTKLLHQQPGTVRAQPLQRQALPHLREGRSGRRRADAAGTRMREVPELPGDTWPPGTLAHQALVQGRGDSLPIPESSPCQHRGTGLASLPYRQPTAREASLEPLTVLRPLCLHLLASPLEVPPVFVRHPGHLDHTPDRLRTRAVAEQHGEPCTGVEPVGLRAPPTTFDLDTRRIAPNVVDPMGQEAAMQPEPVPSSLLTALDASGIG